MITSTKDNFALQKSVCVWGRGGMDPLLSFAGPEITLCHVKFEWTFVTICLWKNQTRPTAIFVSCLWQKIAVSKEARLKFEIKLRKMSTFSMKTI